MQSRRPSVLFAAMLAIAGFGSALVAQLESGDRGISPIDSSGLLDMSGIHVDVGGETAEAARYAGWRAAQRIGFRMLWAKANGASPNDAPAVDDATLDGLVSSIAVEKEQIGPGRYIAIPQTGGEVTIVVTPYDDDILELQGRLDKTVVPYGNIEQQSRTSDVMAEKSAAPSSVKLDNSKYYAKRRLKKEVLTGGGDLLGDVRNKAVEFDKVAEEELPKEIQVQPKAERKIWLDQKLKERAELETQMEGLISQRDTFVNEENKKTTKNTSLDSFDRAVEDTLRVQLN